MMITVYVFVGLAFLALLYFLFCYFLSGTILFLDRQPVPKNPGDYGLDFENVEFKASDNVTIRG